MPRQPHQAAYWEVELPLDLDLRAARRDWCRSNVPAVTGRLPWISPGRPTGDEEFSSWWRDDPGATETWRFADHDAAMMFDMAMESAGEPSFTAL